MLTVIGIYLSPKAPTKISSDHESHQNHMFRNRIRDSLLRKGKDSPKFRHTGEQKMGSVPQSTEPPTSTLSRSFTEGVLLPCFFVKSFSVYSLLFLSRLGRTPVLLFQLAYFTYSFSCPHLQFLFSYQFKSL